MHIQVPSHTRSVVVTQEPSGVYLITLDMDQKHTVERLPPYHPLKAVSWKTVRKLSALLVLSGVAYVGFHVASGSRQRPDVANYVRPTVNLDQAPQAFVPQQPLTPQKSASPFGLE